MKTSELTGAALDWAVAKIEGALAPLGNVVVYDRALVITVGGRFEEPLVNFMPSTDWSQGGPIIEREGINLRAVRAPGHKLHGQWLAAYDHGNTGTLVRWVKRADWPKRSFAGPTPLIAAMRCYVVDTLGNTVEVPEELLS